MGIWNTRGKRVKGTVEAVEHLFNDLLFFPAEMTEVQEKNSFVVGKNVTILQRPV